MSQTFGFRCLLLFLGIALPGLASGSEDWLPISPQDLQLKEVPGNPGASAIQLYYADEIDDTNHTEFFYFRIKILNDGGKRYANVDIPVPPTVSLSDLTARTIHPDGSIVAFDGKPFERTLLKGGGVKILAKTFSFPQAGVGSILEYKYRLKYSDNFVYDHRWIVQHDLFTMREHFWFKYSTRIVATLAWSAPPELHVQRERQTDLDRAWALDVENVAPFDPEEQMPPEDWYRTQVKFFYTKPRTVSLGAFWSSVGSDWAKTIQLFLGDRKEIREAAANVVGKEADAEKKLRALYAKAQQIRNLTYERERTQKEAKKEDLKNNKDVVDVLKHEYGNRNDITRVFVALARAAGFDASIVFVSNRESRLFDEDIPLFEQLDAEIAGVKVDGKLIFLDPGTRFCPYGLIRWMRTDTSAMDMRSPGIFFSIPGPDEEGATTDREAKATLSLDGSLTGEITVRYTGGEALEHRLAALYTDDAGRTKDLEEELKHWLPANATARLTDSRGWDQQDEPLIVRFAVEVPAYASAAGKRLLVPVGLFQSHADPVFNANTRKYPIYFAHPFAEKDSVTIHLPEGYLVESTPPAQAAELLYAKYLRTAVPSAKQLRIDRTFFFKRAQTPPIRYPEVKDYFSKVRAGDEEQFVLRQTDADQKQKPN